MSKRESECKKGGERERGSECEGAKREGARENERGGGGGGGGEVGRERGCVFENQELNKIT